MTSGIYFCNENYNPEINVPNNEIIQDEISPKIELI